MQPCGQSRSTRSGFVRGFIMLPSRKWDLDKLMLFQTHHQHRARRDAPPVQRCCLETHALGLCGHAYPMTIRSTSAFGSFYYLLVRSAGANDDFGGVSKPISDRWRSASCFLAALARSMFTFVHSGGRTPSNFPGNKLVQRRGDNDSGAVLLSKRRRVSQRLLREVRKINGYQNGLYIETG